MLSELSKANSTKGGSQESIQNWSEYISDLTTYAIVYQSLLLF